MMSKCTCSIRDAWQVGILELVGRKKHKVKIRGYVTCQQCGAEWSTTADYIRRLPGANRDTILQWDRLQFENLQLRNSEIAAEITLLKEKIDSLVSEYYKNESLADEVKKRI